MSPINAIPIITTDSYIFEIADGIVNKIDLSHPHESAFILCGDTNVLQIEGTHDMAVLRGEHTKGCTET
ncbi:hypothetical protein DVQ78_20650 [Yersinia enterocolitica]|nr:hypothetical protein [Yersinia enterocolitica]